MLTRRLTAALTAAAGGGLLAFLLVAPARADRFGDGDCDPAAGTCEVSAGSDAEPGGAAGAPSGEEGTDDAGGGEPDDTPEAAGWDCEYSLKETDSDSHPQAGERPSDEHQLMFSTCTDPATGTAIQSVQWVGPGEDGAPVDPAVLALRALDQLRLPQPRIAVNPEDYQLVHLPTWLWLEGDSWSAQSASASVPGLTVTATATPLKALWDLGDGTTVECEAGTKWTRDFDPEESSPDCGHTYLRSSAREPGGEYEVSVTVEWAVSWAGGGESETVPGMTTTAEVSWQVAESQATVQ